MRACIKWKHRDLPSITCGTSWIFSRNPVMLAKLWKELTLSLTTLVYASWNVHFLMPNPMTGLELFSDLYLADWLITLKYAKLIVFHYKAYPWFVSDVTLTDFTETLAWLQLNAVPQVASFGSRCESYVKAGIWKLSKEETFWTLPCTFSEWRRVAPDLLSELNTSSNLLIFKGDLNYRKVRANLVSRV